MKDRVSTQVLSNGAIRYEQFNASGQSQGYVYLKPADEPSEQGTPLNKATFLKDATASFLGLGANAIPDDVALRCSFTYVVDSDQKLSDWLNNVTAGGQNYTSVLIKSGSYIHSGTATIPTTTKKIVGEVGNNISINASFGYAEQAETTADYLCYGLSITFTTVDKTLSNVVNLRNCKIENGRFTNCRNLYCCDCHIKDTQRTQASIYGFYNCTNLVNCSCHLESSNLSCYCFYQCNNLFNCKGKAHSGGLALFVGAFVGCNIVIACQGSGYNGRSSGNGYGFTSCLGVILCSKHLDESSTTSTFNTANCCSVQKTYSSTYAVANTANGGFNDLT